VHKKADDDCHERGVSLIFGYVTFTYIWVKSLKTKKKGKTEFKVLDYKF